MNNKDRIILESITLFNQHGVVSTTTNHIAKHLNISPGNLYFHFKNKEEIIETLFIHMCDETYEMWKTEIQKKPVSPPIEFIEKSLEIFWKYRFFHREMYHLRRENKKLSVLWKKHISKTRRFMRLTYSSWIKNNYLLSPKNSSAALVLDDLILLTASSFFQFYESMEKPATRKPLQMAMRYLLSFLSPYFTPTYHSKIE